MDPHEEDLSRRLKDAAGRIERAPVARAGQNDAIRGARRRLRARVIGQSALALFIVLAVSLTALRALPGDERAGSLLGPGPDATPTSTPTADDPLPPDPRGEPTPVPPEITPRPTGAPSEESDRSRPTPCSAPIASTPTPPSVRVTLDVSQSRRTLAVGEAVELTITVKNEGLTPVPYSRSGQIYDFWVTDDSGTVWVWSHERPFIQPLIFERLDPGEEHSHAEWWKQQRCGDGPPLGPGRYIARALWVSDAENNRAWWSQPVELVIE